MKKYEHNINEERQALLVPTDNFPNITPQEVQLYIVRERNRERGWGFTEADFKALGAPPPWPHVPGMLAAVVLDVMLDNVRETVEEASLFAAAVQPKYYRQPELSFDKSHLRLRPGLTHRRGLSWRIIDLAHMWNQGDVSVSEEPEKLSKIINAMASFYDPANNTRLDNWGVDPLEAMDPSIVPSSAVLWAASYFPKWQQRMHDSHVPVVFIAGYQALRIGMDKSFNSTCHAYLLLGGSGLGERNELILLPNLGAANASLIFLVARSSEDEPIAVPRFLK
ncbi:MAG: hypothetical protein WC575_02515 [Patescibacteria group bacterium]